MNKKVGIWLDSEKAWVISLLGKGQTIEKVESNIETRIRFDGESKPASGRGGALVNPSKKKTNRKKQQMGDYLECLMDKISGAEDVLIFGPAETKTEFSKVIHSRKDKPAVYIESAGKMTERQIIARVRDHFIGRGVSAR